MNLQEAIDAVASDMCFDDTKHMLDFFSARGLKVVENKPETDMPVEICDGSCASGKTCPAPEALGSHAADLAAHDGWTIPELRSSNDFIFDGWEKHARENYRQVCEKLKQAEREVNRLYRERVMPAESQLAEAKTALEGLGSHAADLAALRLEQAQNVKLKNMLCNMVAAPIAWRSAAQALLLKLGSE